MTAHADPTPSTTPTPSTPSTPSIPLTTSGAPTVPNKRSARAPLSTRPTTPGAGDPASPTPRRRTRGARDGRRVGLGFAAAALVALPLALAGCSDASAGGPDPSASTGGATDETSTSAEVLLKPLGLDGRSVDQVIDELDAMPLDQRPVDLIASIRPDALVLTNESGTEARLPMPKDRFYVSVAPYVEQTHECHFHSLTTCIGELRNSEVTVTVTEAQTGKEIVSERRTTEDNGFLGIWVPRGPAYDVRIDHEGRSAETRVVTDSAEAATCLTTMKLTNA